MLSMYTCTSMPHNQTFSLPCWVICTLMVLGTTSAIRGFRIPAEAAAGRYLSSGVVQRSVMPAAMADQTADVMQADEALERPVSIGGNSGGPEISPGGHWLGLGKRAHHNDDMDADDEDVSSLFTPYVSVGVLSNMQQFFDNLRNNLDSLEELPDDEKELLLGRAVATKTNGETSGAAVSSSHNSRSRVSEHRASRPTATAAYLHALRSHRPSHKLRNFVAQVEPTELRGSNSYDPAWLWAGLGRRRR